MTIMLCVDYNAFILTVIYNFKEAGPFPIETLDHIMYTDIHVCLCVDYNAFIYVGVLTNVHRH